MWKYQLAPHHSHADRLDCIATYYPLYNRGGGRRNRKSGRSRSDVQTGARRLPLAWLACSPSARLIAEQVQARQTVFFRYLKEMSPGTEQAASFDGHLTLPPEHTDEEENTNDDDKCAITAESWEAGKEVDQIPLLLATSSTSLSTVRQLLGVEEAADNWLETIVPLADVNHPQHRSTYPRLTHTERESQPKLRTSHLLCGSYVAGCISVLVARSHLALSVNSTLSTCDSNHHSSRVRPNTAHYSPGLTFQEWAANQQSPTDFSAPEERIFLFAPTTSARDVISLPEAAAFHTNPFSEGRPLQIGGIDEYRHEGKLASTTYTAAKLFASEEANSCPVFRKVYVVERLGLTNGLLGVSQWWLQRPIRVQELPTWCWSSEVRCSDEPMHVPLHLKVCVDAFYTSPLYRLHDAYTRWTKALNRLGRGVLQESNQSPSLTVSLLSSIGLAASLFSCVWEGLRCILGCVLAYLYQLLRVSDHTQFNADRNGCRAVSPRDSDRDSLCGGITTIITRNAECCTWMATLGATYATHLEAVDMSHTSLTGLHLLVFALAYTDRRRLLNASRSGHSIAIRALDVAGCTRLHHGTAPGRTEESVRTYLCAVMERGWFQIPQPTPELEARLSIASCVGRSLAWLTLRSSLQLINASGSSIDDAAIRELGYYCLAAEVSSAMSQVAPPLVPGCQAHVLGMDLSSCASVADLSPLAFVTSLMQVLAPFTSITDEGIANLEGAHWRECLREMGVDSSLLSLSKSSQSVQNGEVDALAQNGELSVFSQYAKRFRSHLYHLDFTWCVLLTNISSLRRQRALQYLNISQTGVTSEGMSGLVPETTPSWMCDDGAPPLRVLVAELCDHVDTLDGLAALPCLQKLYIRSGTLAVDGIFSLGIMNRSLTLIDLSYCDKLHDVGCLAVIPTLRVLVLDSTEIPRSGVIGLRHSTSLEVLSVRFCPDFAFIGPDKTLFDSHVVHIPTLKAYIYEDLWGDETLRHAF